MKHAAATRRGQPLLALGLLFAGWTVLRIEMWERPDSTQELPGVRASAGRVAVPPASRHAVANAAGRKRYPATALPHALQQEARLPLPQAAPAVPWLQPVAGTTVVSAVEALAPPRLRKSPTRRPPPDEFYEPPADKDDPRWSGENWVLMRAGSGDAAQAPGAASYGASQAGAIVRYRLGRGEVASSYAYLRTSLAINAPGRDREVALGLGVRPARRLPLRMLVEARLQDTRTSPMQFRPVATVITELPWQHLPLGFRAELYGQAGYAGGRGATPFFDAQGLIDHPLRGVVPRNNDLRVGAGVWAGGQDGAVRLDAGPRLSFRVDPGRLAGPSRVALDWRFRLAGNARPDSGPALTVTSAF